MTTKDEIIELARECGVTHRTWDCQDEQAVEAFYHAAQRQAYERAAAVVEWGMGAEQFRNLTRLILEAAAEKCEEKPMVVKTGFACAKAIRRMKP